MNKDEERGYEKGIFDAQAEAATYEAALKAMRDRDDANGSLPEWYRAQIDAALGAPVGSAPPSDEGGREK